MALGTYSNNQTIAGPAGTNDQLQDFNEEVDHFLLSSEDWPDYLSGAPRSMSSMGSCYLDATSLPSELSLKRATDSDDVIKYTTLRANIGQVSYKGEEAFRIANQNMTIVSLKSWELSRKVGVIVRHLALLPAAAAVTALQTELNLFNRLAADSDNAAKEIEAAFLGWDALVKDIRLVIQEKLNTTGVRDAPAPPPVPQYPFILVLPADSQPVIPPFNSTPAEPEFMCQMFMANKHDTIWTTVAKLDMHLRRLHQHLLCRADPTILVSPIQSGPEGVQYRTELIAKIKVYRDRWLADPTGSLSHSSGLLNASNQAVQNIPYWIGLGTSGIAGLAEPYWATAHDLLPVAAYHLGLTQPENTWDRNDPMDKLFYVPVTNAGTLPPILQPYGIPFGSTCPQGPVWPGLVIPSVPGLYSMMPLPQPGSAVSTIPTRPPIPLTGTPISPTGTNTTEAALRKCTNSLDEVHREVQKLIKFFNAISGMGNFLRTTHIRSFGMSIDRLARPEQVAPTSDQLRILTQSSQRIKTYYLLLNAVAKMYTDVHVRFVQRGLDFLHNMREDRTVAGQQDKYNALKEHESDITRGLVQYARTVCYLCTYGFMKLTAGKQRQRAFDDARANLQSLLSGSTISTPAPNVPFQNQWD